MEDTYAYEAQQAELYGEYFGSVLFIFLSMLVAPRCFSVGKRLVRPEKKSSPLHYNEPFILYLRSFIADKGGGKTVDPFFSMSGTEEESLVSVLNEIAPVFAIGNPSDRYLPYGANRIYVEDAEWKAKVHELAEHAKFVVLRLGYTSNFWWEVEKCMNIVGAEKILFIIPYKYKELPKLESYLFEHGFQTKTLSVDRSKPAKGEIASMLYYEKPGVFTFKNLPKHRFAYFSLSYIDVLKSAMADYSARFGLKYKQKNTQRKAIYIQLILLFLVCLFFVLSGISQIYLIQHR